MEPRERTDMTWAVLLSANDAAAIGDLRTVLGIEGCHVGEQLWLRGLELSDKLRDGLRRLPAIGRYRVGNENALTAEGELVPHGYLPSGPWLKLVDLIGVALAAPVIDVEETPRRPTVKLQLIRDRLLRDPDILICSLSDWLHYAESAPQIRLDAWAFAVRETHEVIVRGMPLPPLPGERWSNHEGILVPAGWIWSPALSASSLRRYIGVSNGDLVRISGETELHYEIIASEFFVRASRSAVRLTAQGVVS